MMGKGKKGKGLMVMLGLGPEEESSDEGGSMREHKREAVKAFFEAGAKKDWDAAAEALKTAYELCAADEDYEEGDEEEEAAEDSEESAAGEEASEEEA